MATYNVNVSQSAIYFPTNLPVGSNTVFNIANDGPADSYFVLETVTPYTENTTKNTSGSFTLSGGVKGLIQSDYFAGVVVAPSGGSLTFVNAAPISGSTLLMKGMGYGAATSSLQSYFAQYQTRVQSSGGYVDPNTETCVNNASDILKQASFLMIPSGYRTGSIFVQNPDNGNGDLTFTRGSSATRVTSGSIIESPRTNLISWSEDFANSYWIKTNLNTSGTPQWIGLPNSPDGLSNSTKIIANTSLSAHGISRNDVVTYSANTTYSFSLYLRKAEIEYAQISFILRNGSTFQENGIININLNSNTFSLSSVLIFQSITGSLDILSNGWVRAAVTVRTPVSGSTRLDATMRLTDSSFNNTFSGNDIDGLFIYGAQLEQGSTATSYIPTTSTARTSFAGIVQNGTSGSNIARLDYSYGTCPSILLEPQRTNLIIRSEELDSTSWGSEGLTITPNSTLSPDNTLSADILQEQAINDFHRVYPSLALGITSGSNYACSFYVKKDTCRYVRLVFGQSAATDVWICAQFDLDTQTFTSGVGSGGGVLLNATITSSFNGFYRITLVGSLPATAARVFLALSNGATISSSDSRGCNVYLGNTSNRIWVWGGQLELGAYNSTYIPTTISSTTRLADIFTRDNIYTSGLISSSGGTWYIELKNNIVYSRDVIGALWIGDNSTSSTLGNALNIRNGGGGRLPIGKTVGGSFNTLYNTLTDNVKIIIKWNGTTADVFVNGVKVVSSTSFAVTNMEFLRGQGTDVPKFIQAMALFNKPLDDADCEIITGATGYDTYSQMATALGYDIV